MIRKVRLEIGSIREMLRIEGLLMEDEDSIEVDSSLRRLQALISFQLAN